VLFKRFAGGIDEGLVLNANRALTSRHPTEVKLGV
jgi:hypothetical protein